MNELTSIKRYFHLIITSPRKILDALPKRNLKRSRFYLPAMTGSLHFVGNNISHPVEEAGNVHPLLARSLHVA